MNSNNVTQLSNFTPKCVPFTSSCKSYGNNFGKYTLANEAKQDQPWSDMLVYTLNCIYHKLLWRIRYIMGGRDDHNYSVAGSSFRIIL